MNEKQQRPSTAGSVHVALRRRAQSVFYFLSRRQTAVDMSDSYTGMQDFIKTFETGLVEYEQIAIQTHLSPCEENTFIYLFECASRSWRRIGIYGFIL